MMPQVGLETRQRAFNTPICPMLPKSDEEEEENNARPPCGVCRTRGQRRWVGEKMETQPRFTSSQGGAKRIKHCHIQLLELAARGQT